MAESQAVLQEQIEGGDHHSDRDGGNGDVPRSGVRMLCRRQQRPSRNSSRQHDGGDSRESEQPRRAIPAK